MSKEKNTRGRPRKYETNAERKKAYRDRKKAEHQALKEKVTKLERKLANLDQEQSESVIEPIFKLTYKDIKNMQIDELKEIYTELNRKTQGKNITLFSPFKNILKVLNSAEENVKEASTKNIAEEVSDNLSSIKELAQRLVIINIIEDELSHREVIFANEEDYQLFEQQLLDLENKIQKLEGSRSKKILTKKIENKD
ncbi:MAG: hypothetical protein FK734_19535 [Asgard group archaeon]|nr:hypothetical protein [Asgard group archaeon]